MSKTASATRSSSVADPHASEHPEDRIYTVMSGVFYIGLGDQFDGAKVKAYPPGCVVVLPGDTAHFHWAGVHPFDRTGSWLR